MPSSERRRARGAAAAGRGRGFEPAARALLAWFARAGRRMAWRETRDPYRIWVSEIMLQQTTVAAAVPYYERFIARFPTLAALAAAPLDDVLKLWEGLGYYSRARNLHRAAAILAGENGGRLPSDVSGLAALPGIGRSTAGAIASIAFGRDEPVLDGNVRRVLARLLGEAEDPARGAAARRLWDASRRCILPGKGRETAFALMDLGSLVCAPRNPRCRECPLSSFCRAREAGLQERIPPKKERRPRPHHDVVVAVIEDARGKVLIDRRPPGGLLGGLWEFPGGRRETGETLEEALSREIGEKLRIGIGIGGKVAEIAHGYTHYTVTIHAFRCRRRAGRIRAAGEWRWVAPERIGDFAFPRSNRKIAEAAFGAV